MICTNKEFGTQQGLDDHLRDFVHPATSPSQGDDAASQAARLRTEERNLYCLDCKQQFQSLTAFRQHKASPRGEDHHGNDIPSDDLEVASQASDRTLAGGNGVRFYTPSATTSSNSSARSWKHITTPSASITSGSSDTGGVILTPRSSAANSVSEWSFINEDLATPSSTPAKSSSGDTVTQPHSDSGYSCPTCVKKFKTARRLLQHLNSPVHAAKVFHCPTDTGRQPHAKGEKKFKTLSGMAQHIEVGACAGGMATLERIVGIFEEKVKQATGKKLRLLKSSSA
ncbi:hypothetical protein KC332_g9297 [Hortaea werneckii]|nr:hypothetical protein KC350_g10501 [Hortaea werneckii]KAI6825847.1 hypothetical protein KC358_g7931 [Hortaea werneckii]KAI6927446.1 hypothetical protein KC348_g8397 [Hortaea werneckii]KAI6932414.1 hypothetical protein KC341_g8979 [Hortaea werneckii]KAI6968763.1 hypothetical protein KC321_g8271 [Hortaea werneckii]